MATIYSLICWGGNAGKTGVSVATSGSVATLTAHGCRTGMGLMPQSTTNGLVIGTPVYARELTDNTFSLHTTASDAISNTGLVTISGAIASIAFKSKYYTNISDATRWGNATPASARIYATLAAWYAARYTAQNATPTPSDTEYAEIGEAFTEWPAGTLTMDCQGMAATTITTMVNGSRTIGFHYGVPGSGYIIKSASGMIFFNTNSYNVTIDGIEIHMRGNSSTGIYTAGSLCCFPIIKNNIIHGLAGATGQRGINIGTSVVTADSNIIYDVIGNEGIYVGSNNGIGAKVRNNTVAKCTTGIYQGGATQGTYENNISVGNTLNWTVTPPNFLSAKFSHNFGELTDRKTCSVVYTTNVNNITCTAHGRVENQPITFTSDGALPTVVATGLPLVSGKVYYLKTKVSNDVFTISASLGGTVIAFSDNGTGTHYTTTIWSSDGTEKYLDLSTNSGNDVFVDYANNDYRPTGTSGTPNAKALQVDTGLTVAGRTTDAAGHTVPNYVPAGSYPDAGALEFDHLNGESPNLRHFTVSGLVSGCRLKVKKTSDGTVIYNGVPSLTAGAYTINYDAGIADTPVTIDIRKSNAAPFYYHLTTTSVISYLGDSGVAVTLIPDIAMGATKATGWSVNTTTGAITHDSGTTVQTVQSLYSYIMDYMDHADRVDLTDRMAGTTSEIFSLINSGSISDADMQYLKGGSIQDGTTLWSNVYTVGSQAASTIMTLRVDGTEYAASYWGAGNLDVMVELPLWDGTEVVDIRARKYTDTYDHWQMVIDGEGRNVAAISTTDDTNNQTTRAAVAGYSISLAVDNPTGKQIDSSDTAADYTITISAGGATVQEVYEWMKYKTDEDNSTNIGSIPGNVYESANASYDEVKASPLGTFAGGILFGAQGVWIEGLDSNDSLNYILTSNDGATHQAEPPLGYQSVTVSGGVAGTRLQIFDLTSDTELYNDIPAVWPHAWNDTNPYSADREIRVRASYVSGATAKLFEEATIGASTSAVPALTYRLAQTNDQVYIGNAVDGSTVTGVSIVDATLLVEVDTGAITWQDLYAYGVYWLDTEEGIRDEGSFVFAKDVANYVWEQFKLKNVTAPPVPLIVTGGYGYDTSGNPLALLDTTGGTIFLAPPHVVASVVTVGGVNIITGDIADIPMYVPSASANASAVLSAAQTAPIHANIKQVADATVNGTGTELDPWGP